MSDGVTRGMKAKTIKAILAKVFERFVESIEDAPLRKQVKENSIITGGAIASMLIGDKVNDYDIYFTDKATTVAVAEYYVRKFRERTDCQLRVDSETERVRIVTPSGHRGETAGDAGILNDAGEIEELYDELTEQASEVVSESKSEYRPVFLSTNAITLSDRIQIVLRFYGHPDQIHENYDFVHCTNYWTSKHGELTLRQPALESLMSRELRYVGSKYPVCSVMRLRKFIKRGWVINAGQILKMLMQVAELDLTDPVVLEDQLTGVDSAYFIQIIQAVKDKDPERINTAYLTEIIDRMF